MASLTFNPALAKPSFSEALLWGVVSLVAYYFLSAVYCLLFSNLKHVPGPWWSLFTNIPDFFHLLGGDRALFIDNLHKKYGRVVRVAPNIVSVHDTESIKQIYGAVGRKPFDKQKLFAGIFNFRGNNYPNLVGFWNARDAMKRRKLYGQAFSTGSILHMEATFQKCFANYAGRVSRLAGNGGAVDVNLQFRKTALDVITELAFGGFYKGNNAKDIDLMALLDEFNIANTLGEQSIEDYVANRQPGTKDCMGPLIDYRDENGEPLPLPSLQIEANMMLVGGTDTTSTTTAYTAWEIARNPNIQETLFKELKSAFPDPKSPISLKDAEKLSYLTQCLKEGLRMHTVLPGPTCRVVPDTGASLCGYDMPPGAITFVQAHTAHYDPSVYAYPEIFEPTRWTDETQQMRNNFLPFSAGPRICLGMNLAYMEMRVMLAHLFRNYYVTVPSECDMTKLEFLLVQPKSGKCILHLTPRTE